MKNYHSVTGFFLPRRNLPKVPAFSPLPQENFRVKQEKQLHPPEKHAILLRLNLRISKPNTQRYRSGHNGNDSKFLEAPAVSSAENVRRTGLCAGSDFTISYRSCVFFLHSSGARITLEIYGELSERSKVRHSKSCFHFGSPNCRKASNHAGLRASSNCELGSVLSCCSSQFPRLEFCGKMAIMRAAI